MYQTQALESIYKAIIPQGIMATAMQVDNYASVWSRDSMMTGIAGLIVKDKKIIEGLKASILSLVDNQNQAGQLPSNISFPEGNTKTSYGSLVGRVDATTWWIVGACIYILNTNDDELKHKIEINISKALKILDAWEFNNKNLIYTPLGGNWADEYIMSGYTLYDNVLRYWALNVAGQVYQNDNWSKKAIMVKQCIEDNFGMETSENPKYHPKAYDELKQSKLEYLPLSFSANGYNTQWDMAGNALALLLGINKKVEGVKSFINELNKEFNHWMLPVFYPIIQKSDWQWNLLKNNFSYSFKNEPYHFHNGGSWPIFLGWLCMGLKANGEDDIPKEILKNYEKLLSQNQTINFNEYYTSNKLEPKGTDHLCFSASGYIMMKNTIKELKLI